jgi:hypothetical protein
MVLCGVQAPVRRGKPFVRRSWRTVIGMLGHGEGGGRQWMLQLVSARAGQVEGGAGRGADPAGRRQFHPCLHANVTI